MRVCGFIIFAFLTYYTGIKGICTLPNFLADTTWRDNDKGLLQFTQSIMTGWTFAHSKTASLTEWECFFNDVSTDGGHLIMKANTVFKLYHNETFTAYLCMRLGKITDYSYYYYLEWPEQSQTPFHERVTVLRESDAVGNAVDDLCWDTTKTDFPTLQEYHILLRTGYEDNAKQNCHSNFFGEFSYNITNLNTSMSYCGTGSENWDVCTDYQTMTFNTSVCNESVAYAENGSVVCVYNISIGSYFVQTVYNQDTSPNATRFTCFMGSAESGGSLSVSQIKGSCTKTQTPYTQPTTPSSTGLNIFLTPHRLCPMLSTTAPDIQEDPVSVIVGATVGVVFVIITTVILILIYLKCRHRKQKREKNLTREATTETKNTENNGCFPLKSDITENRLSSAATPREKISDIDSMHHTCSPNWIQRPQGMPPLETQLTFVETQTKECMSPLAFYLQSRLSDVPKSTSRTGEVDSVVQSISPSGVSLYTRTPIPRWPGPVKMNSFHPVSESKFVQELTKRKIIQTNETFSELKLNTPNKDSPLPQLPPLPISSFKTKAWLTQNFAGTDMEIHQTVDTQNLDAKKQAPNSRIKTLATKSLKKTDDIKKPKRKKSKIAHCDSNREMNREKFRYNIPFNSKGKYNDNLEIMQNDRVHVSGTCKKSSTKTLGRRRLRKNRKVRKVPQDKVRPFRRQKDIKEQNTDSKITSKLIGLQHFLDNENATISLDLGSDHRPVQLKDSSTYKLKTLKKGNQETKKKSSDHESINSDSSDDLEDEEEEDEMEESEKSEFLSDDGDKDTAGSERSSGDTSVGTEVAFKYGDNGGGNNDPDRLVITDYGRKDRFMTRIDRK